MNKRWNQLIDSKVLERNVLRTAYALWAELTSSDSSSVYSVAGAEMRSVDLGDLQGYGGLRRWPPRHAIRSQIPPQSRRCVPGDCGGYICVRSAQTRAGTGGVCIYLAFKVLASSFRLIDDLLPPSPTHQREPLHRRVESWSRLIAETRIASTSSRSLPCKNTSS